MRYLLLAISLSVLFSASANEVKLCCWIVRNNDGAAGFTATEVTNLVSGVNQIYRQVAMSFVIDSLSYTNNTYLSDLVYSNRAQRNAICNITNNTGALELYFIHELNGSPTAFHNINGIVIGPSANERSVSHEIGHACNMRDIYDVHQGTSLSVTGFPAKVRMPDDWGWYPPSLTHADLVKKLLMYGFKSNIKTDISYGDIYGLRYTNSWNSARRDWDKNWFLDLVPIGFGLHGNRHPVSQ